MTWQLRSAIPFSALLLAMHPALAERPIKQKDYVSDGTQGYVVVWVGPMNGRKTPRELLDFLRIDPKTGSTLVSDQPYLRSTNARRVKDAAAIYYESKPWIIRDDFGLFVMPVNPGRWVVGGVNQTAFSMGSYAFDVAPGKTSYIGTVVVGQESNDSIIPEFRKAGEAIAGLIDDENVPNTILLRPADIADLPSEMVWHGLVLPEIARDVRFNNYLSGLVGRAADLGRKPHEPPRSKGQDGLVK